MRPVWKRYLRSRAHAQIHFSRGVGVSRVFSRNAEDSTAKFGALAAAAGAAAAPSVESFVLEGEAVGIDRATGRIRSFQDLAQNSRWGRRTPTHTPVVDCCRAAVPPPHARCKHAAAGARV